MFDCFPAILKFANSFQIHAEAAIAQHIRPSPDNNQERVIVNLDIYKGEIKVDNDQTAFYSTFENTPLSAVTVTALIIRSDN